MAIYTRFGTPVEIVKVETLSREGQWLTLKRPDGSTIVTRPRELKADEGSKEIEAAINAALLT
jgi:hypothetical protein